MRKIAFTNAKGGVAKTSSAVSVGAALARRGRRVCLVDLDSQGQVSKALGMEKAEPGIAELMLGEAALEEAVHSARENLDVIPGSRRLAGVKSSLAQRPVRQELALSEVLDDLEGYDYVLLDTAPNWDVLSVNTLFYADELFVPVSMEGLALQGLADFLQSVEDVRKYRKELDVVGIIPTFFDGRVRKSGDILRQLEGHFGDKVTPAIRYNVKLSEAPVYGETIFEYAASSNGAADYAALADHIEEVSANGKA